MYIIPKWIDPTVVVHKIGKKRAGRLLDDVEHNAMPEHLATGKGLI